MNLEVYTIGRGEADIRLEDPEKTISKRHAELTVSAGGAAYLVDCGSANGTNILRDGRWVRIKQDLVTPETIVRFGACQVRLGELLARLPKRGATTTVHWEAPANCLTLRPLRSAQTGEVEWR